MEEDMPNEDFVLSREQRDDAGYCQELRPDVHAALLWSIRSGRSANRRWK